MSFKSLKKYFYLISIFDDRISIKNFQYFWQDVMQTYSVVLVKIMMECPLMEIMTRVINDIFARLLFNILHISKLHYVTLYHAQTHINFKMYKRNDSQKLEKIRQHFGTLMSKHTSNRSCSNI